MRVQGLARWQGLKCFELIGFLRGFKYERLILSKERDMNIYKCKPRTEGLRLRVYFSGMRDSLNPKP